MLAFLGAVLYTVFPVAFNAGLRLRGSLILATSPIVTSLLARIVNKNRLSRRQFAGVLIGCIGVSLTLVEQPGNTQESGNALLGDALMLLVAISGAVYRVYAKRLVQRYTPLTITAYAMPSDHWCFCLQSSAKGTLLGQRVSATTTCSSYCSWGFAVELSRIIFRRTRCYAYADISGGVHHPQLDCGNHSRRHAPIGKIDAPIRGGLHPCASRGAIGQLAQADGSHACSGIDRKARLILHDLYPRSTIQP